MSNINFIRNSIVKQNRAGLQEGFLVIELLQGLLILGVLLLLISAFHVLSVHWQHQAIKRFEAVNILATELVGISCEQSRVGIQAMAVKTETKSISIPELSVLVGKPVIAQQKLVTATWSDERGTLHTIRLVS